MKTTIELPDALLKQVKIRAVREGRKLKDMVADLIRAGLRTPKQADSEPEARLGTDPDTGLPIILGTQPAAPEEEMTPERIKEVLLADEVERFHALGR